MIEIPTPTAELLRLEAHLASLGAKIDEHLQIIKTRRGGNNHFITDLFWTLKPSGIPICSEHADCLKAISQLRASMIFAG